MDKLLQKRGDIPPDEKANCMIPRQVSYRKVCNVQLGQFPPDHNVIERGLIQHSADSVSHGTILDPGAGARYWLMFVRETPQYKAAAHGVGPLRVHLN